VRCLARRAVGEVGCERAELSTEALSYMRAYDWPDNVRELENVVRAGPSGALMEHAEREAIIAALLAAQGRVVVRPAKGDRAGLDGGWFAPGVDVPARASTSATGPSRPVGGERRVPVLLSRV